jgi:prepilin-type N-terminal cleavage/methylation domain-containing protein
VTSTPRRLPASSAARAPRRGFTLIELLVALVLSMIMAVALLKMQASLGRQTVRTADVGMRDSQARAVMDLITQDLTSAGFELGGTANKCNALLTYNSAGYYVHHRVDALAGSSGTQMKFAPSLTLNYPTGSTASDVLVTTTSSKSTNFNDTTFPVVRVATSGTPTTSGIVTLATALGTGSSASGDAGLTMIPVGTMLACVRVPMSVAALVVTSSGATMPSNNYTGFSGQLSGAGFTGTITDAEIFAGKFVDMGATTAPSQTTVAWYVDNSGTFPTLMRATYSLLDDTIMPNTTPQSIAAGVVSLQVLFGVDPGGTGAVTAYESGATVTTNKHWDNVLTAKLALVTRTVNDDPDSSNYVGPTTIAIGTPFSNITVPASQHRYTVNTTEVALRNYVWN